MSNFSSYPQNRFEEFIDSLQEGLSSLPKQEAKLAQYILLNQGTFALENGNSLANKVGVSSMTVGRLFRRLGYDGIKDVKNLMRHQYVDKENKPDIIRGVPNHLKQAMAAEIDIVATVFKQTSNKQWHAATKILSESQRVYVTGFQAIRGLSEDFSRRLSLVRDNVMYLSPYDGMLAEWTDTTEAAKESCVVIIDTVPYAEKAIQMARLTRTQGRKCIVVSDEYCHWGESLSDAVLFAPSKTNLFFESTIGLTLILGLLVNSVADSHLEESKIRFGRWREQAKKLNLF